MPGDSLPQRKGWNKPLRTKPKKSGTTYMDGTSELSAARTKMDDVLEVWQLNLQHGKSSTAVLAKNLARVDNSVVLIQEPWVKLFVDYAKAFDHIDHNTVIKKLKSLGVPDFIVC